MSYLCKVTKELLKEQELLPNYFCRLYISVGIRNDTGKVAYLYVINTPGKSITSQFYTDYWIACDEGILRFDKVIKKELEDLERIEKELDNERS